MGFFRKKRPKINVDTVDSPNVPRMLPAGFYEMSYEKQRVPDPGAMVYSWETLGLPQYSPVGAGRGILQVIQSVNRPLAFYRAIPIQGMGTVPGQIIFQPLVKGSS